jgi:tetratricopeptide (TPR) repeat protein
MVTKAKTATAPAARSASHPLAEELAKAVKLVDGQKYPEAIKALEGLEAQATDVSMRRHIHTYLELARSKAHPAKAKGEEPEVEVQVLLNRHAHAEALKALEKALKAQPKKADLHYLKAVALAQAGHAEPCAEALKHAIALDRDTLYLFRLEPDFSEFRKSPIFAFTEES